MGIPNFIRGEDVKHIIIISILSSLIPSLPPTMNGKILLKNSSKNQKFCFPISAYISNFDQITISVLKRKCFQIYTSAWRLSGGKLFLFIENLSKGIHYIVEKWFCAWTVPPGKTLSVFLSESKLLIN